jgi:hypothetical protein
LDLYNKRFEIHLRTVKYYQAMMKPKDDEEEEASALQADFIIASREAQFLFAPESGVYRLLLKLNKAPGIITDFRRLPEGLSPKDTTDFHNQRIDALNLWNTSMQPIGGADGAYLNYHYATALSALIGRARAIWSVWSAKSRRGQSDGGMRSG